MPKEVFGRDFRFLDRAELLSFEEITRLARLFVAQGVEKVRITGGEPLVRRDLECLIEQLAEIDGLRDIALTTNGALLSRKALSLQQAGLRRVTISLDALDDQTFGAMNDVGFPVARVLQGIESAVEAGLSPIKINTVVKRGANDQCVVELADHFRHSGHIVRFIEYMDVGATNGWRLDDVVPAGEILEVIDSRWPLEAVDPNYEGEVARRYRYRDGAARSGLLRLSPSPFAAAVLGLVFRRKESSTPVCSPPTAMTFASCCEAERATRR